MEVGKMQKRVFFENLDALRFFCFLSVFFFHSFHTEFDHIRSSSTYHLIKSEIFGNGNIGVNFFFVLSGFLITYLLIEEKKLLGQINLKKFWIRRILRIWPLFYACVLFGFFGFPLIKEAFGEMSTETASIIYYLTFLNNFDFISNGVPDASILSVLWSIAIEEQFYLVWPILLYFVPQKYYWLVPCLVLLVSIAFRAYYDSYIMHEMHTLSCIGDMAIGAIGAWLVIRFQTFKGFIKRLKKYQLLIIYLLFFSVFLLRDDILQKMYVLRVIERPLIAIVILVIILEQNYCANSIFKLSRFKIISRLGRISYGLYCLHFIGILAATTITKKLFINTELWQVLFLDTALALSITIFIAAISYKFYEKPFLTFKRKFTHIVRE